MFNKYATNGTPEQKLEWLRKANKELQDYGPVMTAYERLTVGEEIKRKREEYYPSVTAWALNNHEQAIEQVKNGKRLIREAQAKEINRWDPAKMRENLQFYGEMITNLSNMPADPMRGFYPEDAIKQVFEEAQLSGDMFKQRAACEIIKSLPLQGDQNSKAMMALLQGQARDTLQQLRETDEIKGARDVYNESVRGLASVRDEVIEIGRLMGGDPTNVFASGPYAQAVRRVKFNQGGDVEILEPDDPQVTGIQKIEFKQE